MKITNYREMSEMVVNTGYYKLPYGTLLSIVGEFRDTSNLVSQDMYHCISPKGEHHFIAKRELEEIELCFTEKGIYAVAKSMIRFSARLDREVACYKFSIEDDGVLISKKEFHTLKYLLGGNEDETTTIEERTN